MRELDLWHFAPGALIFLFGLFMPMDGGIANTIYTGVFAIGLVFALYAYWYALRIAMNFADDTRLIEGLGYSALLFLRSTAFWFWLTLAALGLAWRYPDASDLFVPAATIVGSVGAIAFAAGVSWYLIYAAARRAVHTPKRN